MKLFVWAIFVALWPICASVAGELQDASARGDITRVRALLKARPADINAREAGTTALHEATRAGHLDIVTLLVENGANVNAIDFSRLTPLKLALGRRQMTIANYLRSKGGVEQAPVTRPVPARAAPVAPVVPPRALFQTNKPSVVTASREVAPMTTNRSALAPPAPAPREKPASQAEMMAVIFPIHEAARVGDVEQIKFLYKNSPDLVDATDQKGLTPLHVAAANRQFGVAQVLLGLRATVNPKSVGGQTPLHVAVRNSDVAITALLLTNRAEVDARDNFGNTPLLIALQSSDAEALDGGGLASKTPGGGGVALASMKLQQLQLATLLVRHRANVNARNRAGSTPLSQAVRLGNDAVVNLLLASSANPNSAEPGTGKTPLHVAATRGQLGIVQALIRRRAEINAVDSRGETPLCHALREGRTNTIAALRAAGGTIGRTRALSSTEQNLVAFYQQTESALQRASSSEKARILIGLNPTRAECERMFPRHAAAAWKVVDEINRQIKVAFSKPVRDAEQGRDIWRVTPESPGLIVEEWRSRGWLVRDLPAFSLAVDKLGATTRPGDYCLVNNRWVLVPPLRSIAAQFAATEPARR
jgi:ankyrin repeat protein